MAWVIGGSVAWPMLAQRRSPGNESPTDERIEKLKGKWYLCRPGGGRLTGHRRAIRFRTVLCESREAIEHRNGAGQALENRRFEIVDHDFRRKGRATRRSCSKRRSAMACRPA